MEAKIVRLSPKDSPQKGVFILNNEPLLVTLELPWNNNENSLSCIPTGEYECVKTRDRQTFGGMRIPVTYEIQGIENRSGILFHIGNFLKDTTGCVLISERYGDDFSIKDSSTGFTKFIQYLQGADYFPLSIVAPLW